MTTAERLELLEYKVRTLEEMLRLTQEYLNARTEREHYEAEYDELLATQPRTYEIIEVGKVRVE